MSLPIRLRQKMKAPLILLSILILINSLQAAEYTIRDEEDLITEEQEKIIAKSQAEILAEQDTIVSFAFYQIGTSKLNTRLNWEAALEKAKEDGTASDKFQLLISVGVFSTQNTVDVFYKNPPALQDVDDLGTCIASLEQSLGSEPEVNDLVINAPDIIKGRLSYLKERPLYEAKEQKSAQDTRTKEFTKYIMWLVKIALIIIIPIIAFLVFWYMMSSINNKRTHRFPTTKHASPKSRLGAPYAGTSISQFTKK